MLVHVRAAAAAAAGDGTWIVGTVSDSGTDGRTSSSVSPACCDPLS